MKKNIALLTVILLAFCMTACSNSHNDEASFPLSEAQTEDEQVDDAYGDDDSKRAAQFVQTQSIPCTVNCDTIMYADKSLTDYRCKIPAGATVYNEHNPDGVAIFVSYTDENGVKFDGWIEEANCDLPALDYPTWDGDMDYSVETKEGFVNAMGYSSETDYLIWVSRYTQRVMIFTGSKGNWKLQNTYLCSTGSNETPTPTGIFAVEEHYGTWYFNDYVVYYPTGYDGDFAFHSTLYGYDGSDYDPTLGAPASQGCVRMAKNDAYYIYSNIPIGTTVVIW